MLKKRKPKPSIPIIKRFWKMLDVRGPDECWPWTGHANKAGYGTLASRIGGRLYCVQTHRVAYSIHHGGIPDGMCVCHSCDNPSCCNPAHLWLGTPGQNNRDRALKGRNHKPRLLTPEQVALARAVSPKIMADGKLAEEFGCSASTVNRARFGYDRYYDHIGPVPDPLG